MNNPDTKFANAYMLKNIYFRCLIKICLTSNVCAYSLIIASIFLHHEINLEQKHLFYIEMHSYILHSQNGKKKKKNEPRNFPSLHKYNESLIAEHNFMLERNTIAKSEKKKIKTLSWKMKL